MKYLLIILLLFLYNNIYGFYTVTIYNFDGTISKVYNNITSISYYDANYIKFYTQDNKQITSNRDYIVIEN